MLSGSTKDLAISRPVTKKTTVETTKWALSEFFYTTGSGGGRGKVGVKLKGIPFSSPSLHRSHRPWVGGGSDDTTEAFVLASWQEYARAFRAFAEGECEAIRELLQAGYENDEEDFAAKLAAHQEALHVQTVEKYRAHAEDFLRRLGEIES